MHEILPSIFTWGATYADSPWDLNGYAIALQGCRVLVDPPAPEEADWPNFDALKQIAKIVLTNRDHVWDTKVFQTRYGAHLVAGTDEVTELAPLVIDEPVREGDLVSDRPVKIQNRLRLLEKWQRRKSRTSSGRKNANCKSRVQIGRIDRKGRN